MTRRGYDHHRFQFGVAALGLACMLLSGCSGKVTGIAIPSPPTSSNSDIARAAYGAPRVSNPISDTSKVESDPCSAASTADIESLGATVDRTQVDDLGNTGKECRWVFTDEYGNIAAGPATGNHDGLSGIYYQHAHGALTTFKPQPTIAGHPAVVYDNGGETDGKCALAVGIRDDLDYTIIARLDTGNPQVGRPCDVATNLAKIIIGNIKAM